MNLLKGNFMRGFSYTFIANILSTMVSTIVVLILPKFIGVTEYGMWQLYVFYTTYIAYMSFGITDGAYLRYGGEEYDELPRDVFISQYWILVIFNIVVESVVFIVFALNTSNVDRTYIILCVCIAGILMVPQSLLKLMMQATNKIKENAMIMIIERGVYFLLVLILLFVGQYSFIYMIVADLIGKFLSGIYAIIQMKELVFGKFASFHKSLKELSINMKVGMKLLLANLSGLLIIGVVRFGIEQNWGIETFGKISLTFSISNMVMLLINSVGLILFPALRRVNSESLANIYLHSKELLMVLAFAVLWMYYPANYFLSMWLPQYSESLDFMAILFPMIVFESKIVLLINTFLKTMRQENIMFFVNVLILGISVIVTGISIGFLDNLFLAILSIPLLIALKSVISEYFLIKQLNLSFNADGILELMMSLAFIIISWKLTLLEAAIIYFGVFILYVIIRRKKLRASIEFISLIK